MIKIIHSNQFKNTNEIQTRNIKLQENRIGFEYTVQTLTKACCFIEPIMLDSYDMKVLSRLSTEDLIIKQLQILDLLK